MGLLLHLACTLGVAGGYAAFRGRASQAFCSSLELTFKCKGVSSLSRAGWLSLSPGAVTMFGDAALVSFYEFSHKSSG